MDRQKFFTVAATGMLKQGERCMDYTECRYGYDGKHCAIGFNIPEGHPAIEYIGSVEYLFEDHPDLMELWGLDPSDPSFLEDLDFLMDLQAAHDGGGDFKKELAAVASKYNLEL